MITIEVIMELIFKLLVVFSAFVFISFAIFMVIMIIAVIANEIIFHIKK